MADIQSKNNTLKKSFSMLSCVNIIQGDNKVKIENFVFKTPSPSVLPSPPQNLRRNVPSANFTKKRTLPSRPNTNSYHINLLPSQTQPLARCNSYHSSNKFSQMEATLKRCDSIGKFDTTSRPLSKQSQIMRAFSITPPPLPENKIISLKKQRETVYNKKTFINKSILKPSMQMGECSNNEIIDYKEVYNEMLDEEEIEKKFLIKSKGPDSIEPSTNNIKKFLSKNKTYIELRDIAIKGEDNTLEKRDSYIKNSFTFYSRGKTAAPKNYQFRDGTEKKLSRKVTAIDHLLNGVDINLLLSKQASDSVDGFDKDEWLKSVGKKGKQFLNKVKLGNLDNFSTRLKYEMSQLELVKNDIHKTLGLAISRIYKEAVNK